MFREGLGAGLPMQYGVYMYMYMHVTNPLSKKVHPQLIKILFINKAM